MGKYELFDPILGVETVFNQLWLLLYLRAELDLRLTNTLDCSFPEILSTKTLEHFSAFYWQHGIQKFDKPIKKMKKTK